VEDAAERRYGNLVRFMHSFSPPLTPPEGGLEGLRARLALPQAPLDLDFAFKGDAWAADEDDQESDGPAAAPDARAPAAGERVARTPGSSRRPSAGGPGALGAIPGALGAIPGAEAAEGEAPCTPASRRASSRPGSRGSPSLEWGEGAYSRDTGRGNSREGGGGGGGGAEPLFLTEVPAGRAPGSRGAASRGSQRAGRSAAGSRNGSKSASRRGVRLRTAGPFEAEQRARAAAKQALYDMFHGGADKGGMLHPDAAGPQAPPPPFSY